MSFRERLIPRERFMNLPLLSILKGMDLSSYDQPPPAIASCLGS